GQAGSLALIVGIGAISSMIAAPIAGALSDRTRTRIGGRAPWMIVGAVATLLLAITLGFATTIPLIVVIVVAMQFTTNLI
ncbi:MFS transporter, partial [Escherichia coli]|uniref:MFS transporter n=1 Tax=Escherichia coli TaxID=562 RepID=UPI0028DE3B38